MRAALVAALTTALYSIGLSISPPHLTHDEIKFALQAKSIADSGRDLNGRLLPLYFIEPGFSVGRDPICIYVTALVLKVLPLSDSSIRLATAIVGGIGVGLVFILGRLLFADRLVAWLVAAVLALSPTYYIHSRLALSVLYPIPFTILWLTTLHRYLETRRPRDAWLAGGVLGAGVYSYLAAALMMPVYLTATVVALSVRRDYRGARQASLGFILLMLPIAIWQIVEPDRYNNILSAYRLYDVTQSSPLETVRNLLSPAALAARLHVYWDALNPGRLFFTGESSLQISTREVGSLLTPVAVLLVVGIVTLCRAPRTALGGLLLFGLFSAPLPAVAMADVEIRRWLVFLPFVAAVSGFGIARVLNAGTPGRTLIAVLMVVCGLQFATFLRDYFGPYRERSSAWFGGNIRSALEQVLSDAARDAPTAVYIASDVPWVEAYWRFYSAVHGQNLIERTRYLSLQAREVPPADPGSVFVTPLLDETARRALFDSGWARQEVIADLDGRPSLMLLRPPPP